MTDHELLEARAQIARLQRRVERERSARQESEEIAERSLRRLYARQRALDLFDTVSIGLERGHRRPRRLL